MRATTTWAQRQARGSAWGLDAQWVDLLASLNGPESIQERIAAIPMNFERDTCWSVQEVLRRDRAMCLEGAFVAAAALWMQGRPPLLVRMFASDGMDHAVAPFLRRGRWGAISKTNHLWCRWRDPVYQSLRELMMSYVHEYGAGSQRTLRGYCDPFDLRCLPVSAWITRADSCAQVCHKLARWGYRALFDDGAVALRPRDALEIRGDAVVEFPAT